MEASLPRVVLASQSPRRLELLTDMGFRPEVIPASVDEAPVRTEPPEAMAVRLALAKAQAVAREAPDGLIIAADTVVALEGKVLGKPRTGQEAFDMLMRLRGRRHLVHTGLALRYGPGGQEVVQLATTPVLMRTYSELDMRAYIQTGDPMDKAGAYAIQNAGFDPVQRTEDCYANVIGLPLCHLYRVLAAWGLAPPRHPLERCPWPVQTGGCRWAGPILKVPFVDARTAGDD
jgi:MAF protein